MHRAIAISILATIIISLIAVSLLILYFTGVYKPLFKSSTHLANRTGSEMSNATILYLINTGKIKEACEELGVEQGTVVVGNCVIDCTNYVSSCK